MTAAASVAERYESDEEDSDEEYFNEECYFDEHFFDDFLDNFDDDHEEHPPPGPAIPVAS